MINWFYDVTGIDLQDVEDRVVEEFNAEMEAAGQAAEVAIDGLSKPCWHTGRCDETMVGL